MKLGRIEKVLLILGVISFLVGPIIGIPCCLYAYTKYKYTPKVSYIISIILSIIGFIIYTIIGIMVFM